MGHATTRSDSCVAQVWSRMWSIGRGQEGAVKRPMHVCCGHANMSSGFESYVSVVNIRILCGRCQMGVWSRRPMHVRLPLTHTHTHTHTHIHTATSLPHLWVTSRDKRRHVSRIRRKTETSIHMCQSLRTFMCEKTWLKQIEQFLSSPGCRQAVRWQSSCQNAWQNTAL
jgi:hypothetical protein